MSENNPVSEEQKSMTFEALVRNQGPNNILHVIEIAKKQREAGRDGVILEAPDKSFNMNVTDERVNFRFDGMGPYVLGIDLATNIANSVAAEDEA